LRATSGGPNLELLQHGAVRLQPVQVLLPPPLHILDVAAQLEFESKR